MTISVLLASAFTFYNIVPCVVGQEERQAEQMAEYRRETGNDIVLYCLSIAPAIAPAEAKADVLVESWRKFAAACRRIDPALKPGVLFQSLIGHSPMFDVEAKATDPWTRTYDAWGKSPRWCWLDKGFAGYLSSVVRRVAAEKPAFVLTDDDCRSRQECFCALHAAKFNAATGKKLTGEEWRKLIAALPTSDPVFRKVNAVIRADVTDIQRIVRRALDEVDPSIPAGMCEAGEEYLFSDAHARAIAAKGQRPVCRLSSGLYLEQQRGEYPFQASLCRVQAIVALHDGTADLLDEADTFPHNYWSRSAVGWHTHLAQAILCGLKGAKIWFVNAVRPQQGAVPKGYTRSLAQYRGFYQELARSVEGLSPVGVVTPVAKHPEDYDFTKPCWINFPVDGHTWGETALTHFGVPLRAASEFSSDAIYELGGSNSVNRLRDDELKAILSRRVLVDGNAARALAGRGFGDLLGVDIADEAPPFTFEAFAGTRETCGPLRNKDRVPGYTLHPGAEAFTELRYGRFYEDGEYQYYPENAKAAVAAPGTVVFRNRLGGTVATTAYGDYVEFYARFSHARKVWLDRVLARLNGGRALDYTALNDQDIAVLAHASPDGRTAVVGVFNFNLQPLETVDLALSSAPSRVEALGDDGVWRPVETSFADGRLTVRRPLASWGVAAFRIMR